MGDSDDTSVRTRASMMNQSQFVIVFLLSVFAAGLALPTVRESPLADDHAMYDDPTFFGPTADDIDPTVDSTVQRLLKRAQMDPVNHSRRRSQVSIRQSTYSSPEGTNDGTSLPMKSSLIAPATPQDNAPPSPSASYDKAEADTRIALGASAGALAFVLVVFGAVVLSVQQSNELAKLRHNPPSLKRGSRSVK